MTATDDTAGHPAGDTAAGETATGRPPDTGTRAGPLADEQSVRRTVAREHRPRRTAPAVIVALLLAAAAILGAVEVISRLVGQPLGLLPVDDLTRIGSDTTWDDPGTIAVAVVVVLVGLLLLVLGLTPGRPRARALAPAQPGVVVAVAHGDLERLAARSAEHVDGVDVATASAGNGRVHVRADSPLHDPGDLDEQVRQAVSERLDQLGLLEPPRIRITVRHRED